VAGLVLVSSPPVDLDPSPRLAAAWEAEETALEADDVEAAVRAVVDAWTLPDAPAALRALVADMQRRAFVLQAEIADDAPEPPDPVEDDPTTVERIDVPALVAVGEHDMPDFVDAAGELARALPRSGPAVVIDGAGHLAPLETPDAFTDLLVGFLKREA
jgi:pimeloyl-ACP methyl ester carboxylesterase